MLGKNKRVARKQLLEQAVQSKQQNELIAQELYKKNLELAHTNRTLSLMRSIDELVLQAETTINELAEGVIKAVLQTATFTLGALYVSSNEEHGPPYFLKGVSCVEPGLYAAKLEGLSNARLVPAKDWFMEQQTKSHVLHMNEFHAAVASGYFSTKADELYRLAVSMNTKSLCLVRLMARQNVVGILCIGLLEIPEKMSTEELKLLERLSEAVGVAIDNKLLFEENQRVLRKLEQSNTKLKALDTAKDEFISMASHQLRTPLTSVKGYLSMLDEGDAGKLNATQKQFVNQALVSSQRMVYLIADLLNVSRLKTGKFIIEPTPVYLPDLIDSEITQLFEAVKARGITMKFNKPAKFPQLMLDETKIRQVVMNFTDNAIYYTPAGGSITLDLKETPQSIEFTVTDTGIGVPKAEQHHLFTKFYRAGNARKARPDGTGLGLFMAKKVVVAQGGAIIFKTQEGKGSTFGFSFAKEKLKVPASAGTSIK
jgi:signal transduction histidine kinase